jgi:hypothetical protein
MPDLLQDADGRKTEKLGDIPKASAQKQLPKWDEYLTKAGQLASLRREVQILKDAVRDTLKKKLKLEDNLDFTVDKAGTVTVFKVFGEKKRGSKPKDLSASF